MGRNFNYIRIEDGKIKNSYEDDKMRNIFISLAETTLNEKYVLGTEYGIDCVREDNPMFGAEGENASWNGDRWVSEQRDIFGLGVNTLNIQNWKWHYWGLQELSEKNKGKYGVPHPGYENNIYFRINRQEDQICIADASVIRDYSKIKFALNRKVSNSEVLEDWICVPQQFVRTYNKQTNGLWLLDGPYCGPSQDEINRLKRNRAIEVAKQVLNKK